jgi:hypothetical protein
VPRVEGEQGSEGGVVVAPEIGREAVAGGDGVVEGGIGEA